MSDDAHGNSKTAGPQMIKHAARTAQHIWTGSAQTAFAEFFILAAFCTAVMMFFASQ